METLLDLLINRGISPRKSSNSQGGEWVSPCPGPICGGAGQDRFHVWPHRQSGGKVAGKFWCRQCQISGDTISFLQLVDGLDFAAACAELGIATGGLQPKRSSYSTTPVPLPDRDGWRPAEYPNPELLWQQKAANFLIDCQKRLQVTPEALNWLRERGITAEMAAEFGLGYNVSSRGGDRYRPRARWGLPVKMQGHTEKKLWLPRGFVIPSWDAEGRIVNLRIRRLAEDIATFGHAIKYLAVDGSSMGTMVLHPKSEVYVVVESGFDAILLAGIANKKIGSMTTWNSSARPDNYAHKLLSGCSLILGGLDYDRGGDREQKWWMDRYPQYRRLPALPQGIKDPGDAAKAGVDLLSWIKDGLPRGIQIKLGMVGGTRPVPQTTKPPAMQAGSIPDGQRGVVPAPQVFELEIIGGKTVYVTDDAAARDGLAAEGKPVFSQRELLRLQQAIDGLGAEDRAAAILGTVEAKEVFGGYIVRGKK